MRKKRCRRGIWYTLDDSPTGVYGREWGSEKRFVIRNTASYDRWMCRTWAWKQREHKFITIVCTLLLTNSELERLLGTAKDKDRKDLILEALQSLSANRDNGQSKSPCAPSSNGHASVRTNNKIIDQIEIIWPAGINTQRIVDRKNSFSMHNRRYLVRLQCQI